MSWWTIIKSHPRLVEMIGNSSEKLVKLADEEEMIELWNASNPELQMQSRDSRGLQKYPIDKWFGYIKIVEGKPVLGAVGGYAIRQGKEGKPFAYIGGIKGNKTPEFKGIPTEIIRPTYLKEVEGIPKIAGLTNMGSLRFVEGTPTQPETHEVIPDDVLEYFRNAQRYATWNVTKSNSWGVWV